MVQVYSGYVLLLIRNYFPDLTCLGNGPAAEHPDRHPVRRHYGFKALYREALGGGFALYRDGLSTGGDRVICLLAALTRRPAWAAQLADHPCAVYPRGNDPGSADHCF